MQFVQLLYIADIPVWHPEDGQRSDRNMLAKSNVCFIDILSILSMWCF